jgi:nucleoside-diphosphate-sugar epimerase
MTNGSIAVVTGANGFVGSHLVDLLLERGYRVRALVRESSDLRWLEGKDVELFKSGLFDLDGLRRAFEGAEYIFHVAGVVKSKKPEGYFKNNVGSTANILEVALETPDQFKKIVVVGSQTAAGPSEGEPIDETRELRPITTYGKSKAEQEKLALSYADRLPVTVCRASAVYGERDTEIFIFFQTFQNGLMTRVGFDEKRLNLIHVRDLVEGLLQAAESERTTGEPYFLASEKLYSWNEIGDITREVIGRKAIRLRVPHFAVYSIAGVAQFFSIFSKKAATLNIEKARDLTRRLWTCSVEKAKEHFGFRQKISAEEGIKRTVAWYREHGWLKPAREKR